MRAVESSDDESEGEKRPRIENEEVTNKPDLDKEEAPKSETKQSESAEDTVAKEVDDLFGDEDSDSIVC